MGLLHVVDALAAHLSASILPPPALVGGASPVVLGDLPALTVAVADVVVAHPGVGRLPRSTVEGALRVDTQIALADPVIRDGAETVELLSADRRMLQLAHGGVVRADGLPDLPFAPGDLAVVVAGVPVAVVPSPPGPGQASLEPLAGVLTFQDPLPAAGTLALGYFVGRWDVEVERFAGEITVDVVAADAAGVDALTRQVEAALGPHAWRGVAGLQDLQPIAIGRVVAPDATAGPGRRRTLTYRFDFERIVPAVRTSGGPIRTLAVGLTGLGEQFTIP